MKVYALESMIQSRNGIMSEVKQRDSESKRI